MTDKIFGSIVLPIKPPVAATGAAVHYIEAADDPAELPNVPAFFGGYADDLLGDLGFDVAPEAPATAPRGSIKRA